MSKRQLLRQLRDRSVLRCETCPGPADFRMTYLRDNTTHLICRVCLKDGVMKAISEAATAASVHAGEFVPAAPTEGKSLILDESGAPIAPSDSAV